MKFNNFLNELWVEGGIRRNDNILLHSNMAPLLFKLKKKKFIFKVEDILFNLINYLGPSGSLILPTFFFKFSEKKFFSRLKTKSEMGKLSEIALNEFPYKRTWHPVYSFIVIGNVPESEILKKNYSALGKDSIFNWLLQVNGKIAILDLNDQNSMTFYHFIEELNQVSYREFKNLKGSYEDWGNEKYKVDAKIFVRKKNILTDVHNMEKILWENNCYNAAKKFNYSGLRSCNMNKVKIEVEKIINKNKAEGILYNLCK